MYKNRLQEMCHRRMWAVPDYTVSRDGPDHDPRFRASVAVNGVSFRAIEPSKSSKDAQNKAAQVAVDHFAVDIPPKPSPQPPVIENHIPYKSQLLTYAQRNKIDLPKYDVVREGYAHALRFKANVTVNGQTFTSLEFFNTLKEAENDAARVAFSSLSLDGNTQDKSILYKNVLQQLAQKEGISLPKYNTVSIGEGHMPNFSSTVEIRGDSFTGDAANTKKQAEMNAAKVAWCELKERSNANAGSASLSLACSMNEASLSLVCSANEHVEPASSGSQSKDDKKLELPNPLSLQLSHVNMKYNVDSSATRQKGGITDKKGSSTVMASVSDYQGALLIDITNGNDNEHMKNISASHNNLAFEVRKEKEDTPEVTFSQDGNSTPSSKSDCSSTVNVIAEFPATRTGSSLSCNRVRVYPRKPDMVLPAGATILPFSDDTWIAVSLDFPNHEGLDTNFERCSHSSSSSLHDELTPASLGSQSKATQNVELPYSSVMMNHSGENSVDGIAIEGNGSNSIRREILANGNGDLEGLDSSFHKLDIEVAEDAPSSSTVNVDFLLECNRVQVYPSEPDMVLPDGASQLPFSDDKWVALSFDF